MQLTAVNTKAIQELHGKEVEGRVRSVPDAEHRLRVLRCAAADRPYPRTLHAPLPASLRLSSRGMKVCAADGSSGKLRRDSCDLSLSIQLLWQRGCLYLPFFACFVLILRVMSRVAGQAHHHFNLNP